MSSKEPVKITLPDDDEGSPGGWMLLRGPGDRFKSGERKALYEYVDELRAAGVGDISQNLQLVRRMIAFILRDWSFDLPKPHAIVAGGTVTGYEYLEALDDLDTDAEDELLLHAGRWLKQIAVNFSPGGQNPESPTGPSAA